MKPLDEYPHTQPDRCNVCGAEVVWVRGVSGVYIPVDPEPVQGGEVTIIAGRVQPPVNELLGLILGPDQRYTQHLRTCPELRTQEARRERLEEAMTKESPAREITTCKCGARMWFATTEKGKQIPLQEHPSPTGNIFLRDGVAVYVSAKNPAPEGAELYLSHFVDCPASAQFRSKKE